MKFIALPVSKGDSFLLKDNMVNIIVDGGEEENECLELVKKYINESINLLICTHYDSDHINGLIGLLKSKINLFECWLPDAFGKINETYKKNEHLLSNLMDKNFDEKYKNCYLCSYCINNKFINNRFLGFYKLSKNQINKINNIVDLCNKRKINIRYLKYINQLQENKISDSFDMFGLNCVETKNIYFYTKVEDLLFALTQINKESLVFKYKKKYLPDILFTADSNFKFLDKNQKIILKDSSISTAAHHGSNDNKNTYNLIKGNNIIFVRSDYKNEKRPCYEFIKQKKKYCTICNNKDNSQVIILDYKNGKWKTEKGNKCTCE